YRREFHCHAISRRHRRLVGAGRRSRPSRIGPADSDGHDIVGREPFHRRSVARGFLDYRPERRGRYRPKLETKTQMTANILEATGIRSENRSEEHTSELQSLT